ncbi:glycoside hydrolase family 2 TIM barrel-domain containing protein [Flavobacterium luteolum]|uniref:glycoside hydrolase family 2 TIM barrel-domain containing protein n=1 Tax=Flavobacterium luteolum TaxID=3003259 RepID=UPI00248EACEA|nr:glycoside hydrolase family 2 TIM barrel-domain containing protein [Flavobacterium luteolum]
MKRTLVNLITSILLINNIKEQKKQFLIFAAMLIMTSNISIGQNAQREVSFNSSWLFINKDVCTADQSNYDDSSWRKLNLPHDWSIEDLPNQQAGQVVGPFSKKSIGKAATGWTVGGTAWYRKKFTLSPKDTGKNISIYFDGVYMNSDVWVNGRHAGYQPYGYSAFCYDITPFLNKDGKENVIAVKVRNEGKNSRWYSGSGIYRNVSLIITEPLHIQTWGVAVTTPEISAKQAKVNLQVKVTNHSEHSKSGILNTKIINSKGKVVSQSEKKYNIDAQQNGEISEQIEVQSPELWSVETPALYKAVTEILDGGKVIDRVETSFGIREIKFDGVNGFQLNGKKIILKGGCIHHDNGPLGAAAFERAEERKIEILKNSGFNAVRTSHNPPSQALLDACDRLGMLVMDEAFDMWVRPKNPEDYNLNFNEWWKKDLHAMLLRDRNHPSIIMWSIGNEIYEAPDLLGQEIGKTLADEVRKIDPTRPVTEAFVYLPGFTKKSLTAYIPHMDNIDVEGYNYFLEGSSVYFQRDSSVVNFVDRQNERQPDKTFVVTESLPFFALENYNKSLVSPYMIGSFKWTAFDYIGEAGIGKSRFKLKSRPDGSGIAGMGIFFKDEWPIFNAACGDFDLIGNKKAASYYQDVVWGISPLEILVHDAVPDGMKEAVSPWGFAEQRKSWTWPGQEGKKQLVYVYTKAQKVVLKINGKTAGEQNIAEGSVTAVFEVDYQPGIISAEGYNNGKKVYYKELKTSGEAAAIRLTADRKVLHKSSNDLAYISVEIVDKQGNLVPNIDDLEIEYKLDGNASIAGLGNGNPSDMSSFQGTSKKVFQGKGLVIIKADDSSGEVILTARANKLQESHIRIKIN